MQFASGLREAEGFRHCYEITEVPDVHALILKLGGPVIKAGRINRLSVD
jgi:hypothetical protein